MRTRQRHKAHTQDQRRPARTAARSWLAIAAVVLLLVSISGCKPAADTVVIKFLKFNPEVLTVNAGTTVTWRNEDQTAHTVTSDLNDSTSAPAAQKFSSEPLNPGQTFTHTFDTAGTYHYHCEIHGYLKGTVIVK